MSPEDRVDPFVVLVGIAEDRHDAKRLLPIVAMAYERADGTGSATLSRAGDTYTVSTAFFTPGAQVGGTLPMTRNFHREVAQVLREAGERVAG